MIGQPDPRVEASRPGDTGPARDDRVQPVGPDHDRGAERGGPAIGAADGELPGARVGVGHVPAAPDVGARADREIEERRIEPRPVEADRGLAAGLGAVGQAEGGPDGVSTRIAGIGRATVARVAASRPARRRAATAAGEVKTPPARQRQAGDRSRTTTSRPAAASRAARTAPAGPPPTIAIADPLDGTVARHQSPAPCGSGGVPRSGSSPGVGTAAIA